jgi:transposase InsO family protein
MYLTAIIDVYSRYVVGWDIFNSLDAENTLEVLKQAIKDHGKPEIINSDQGSLPSRRHGPGGGCTGKNFSRIMGWIGWIYAP